MSIHLAAVRAYPFPSGFGRPSWDTGWLVQFAHRAGEDRFGFVWDRAQDAVVLKWTLGME